MNNCAREIDCDSLRMILLWYVVKKSKFLPLMQRICKEITVKSLHSVIVYLEMKY